MPSRRHLLAAALVLPLAGAALSGERRVAGVGGVALHGHDPVAYFTHGAAVPGDPHHAVKWKGALWYFSSEESRLAFEMDPRRYAPQFGGYCAMSLAEGTLRTGAPDIWVLRHGRLYLFGSVAARDRWARDPEGNHARADANWPRAMGK